jgi:hypothetical protein
MIKERGGLASRTAVVWLPPAARPTYSRKIGYEGCMKTCQRQALGFRRLHCRLMLLWAYGVYAKQRTG